MKVTPAKPGRRSVVMSAGAIMVTLCGWLLGSTAPPAEAQNATNPPPIPGLPFGQNVLPGSLHGLKIGYFNFTDSVFTNATSRDVQRQIQLAGGTEDFCPVSDAATTLACVRSFASAHVAGIIGFQGFPASDSAVCAAAPKVPFVSLYVPNGMCSKTAVVAPNYQAGMLTGEQLGLFAHWRFNCQINAFVTLYQAGTQAALDMSNGQLAGYEQVCGKLPSNMIRVGDGPGDSETSGAETYMASLLQALPGDHAIIVAGEDDDAVVGAIAAARAAGRSTDIFVGANGADPGFLKGISSPQWIGDAAYFPEAYGRVAVPALVRMLHSQAMPSLVLMPTVLLNFSNVDEYYPGSVKSGAQSS
jgi:ribose transport system substrate-binding protein